LPHTDVGKKEHALPTSLLLRSQSGSGQGSQLSMPHTGTEVFSVVPSMPSRIQ
jgi:hypothetical protein